MKGVIRQQRGEGEVGARTAGCSKQGPGRPGHRPHGRSVPRRGVNRKQPVWLVHDESEGEEVRDESKVAVR